MAHGDTLTEQYAKEQQDSSKPPATSPNGIPVVDLAGIDGPERERICKQIAEACETWGFFQLINHGIDQSLIKRVKHVSSEFFHAPMEEKSKIRVQPPLIYGWNHPNNMIEGHNLVQKDTVEHMVLYMYPERPEYLERHPTHPASYTSTLLEYTKEIVILGEKLLGILSEMLGLESEALQTALKVGSASQTLDIISRTNFYGLNEDGEAIQRVCHAHSDPNSLTMLLADDVSGLEVRKDDGWVKVESIPGGLIINVGDVVEICSNGRYKSSNHRGLPGHKQERLTLGMFQCPEKDAWVGPIKSLLDETHPPVYKTSTFGDYLAEFVKGGLEGKTVLERHKL